MYVLGEVGEAGQSKAKRGIIRGTFVARRVKADFTRFNLPEKVTYLVCGKQPEK